MPDENYENLKFKIRYQVKEYIEHARLPLGPSENGDLVTVCPICGQPAKVLVFPFEDPHSRWSYTSCEGKGDAIHFAMAAFGFKTEAKAVLDICRKLDEPVTFLDTISAEELMDKEFPPLTELIEGMLAPGLYILAGASKIGKSWLVLQMAHHVSTGTSLWGRKALKRDVLYLCLEDTQERIQRRLMTVCNGETGNIDFATDAEIMGMGFEEQVSSFLAGHPNTKLVIVDTLIKIRSINASRSAYADDYATMTVLKNLAERFKIALVMVHHTRKLESQDIMEMISGTNGLMGCADGAIVLDRPKRQLPEGSLTMTGRDFADAKILLRQNRETMCWEFVGYEDEQPEEARDPVLSAVSVLVSARGEWKGTATDLVACLREIDPQLDLTPNSIARKLNCTVKTLQEYTAHTLDGIIDKVVRQIFDRMKAIPKSEIVNIRYKEKMEERKALLQSVRAEYTKAASELEMFRAEVIKSLRGESSFSQALLNSLIADAETKCHEVQRKMEAAQAAYDEGKAVLAALNAQYDDIISWSEMYDTASIEAKKMIVSCLIRRVEVYRDYKLHIDFNIDFEQFSGGLDIVAIAA